MKKATPNQTCVPAWDADLSDSYIRECYKAYHEKWRARYSIGDFYYGPHETRFYSSVKYHYTGQKADWLFIEYLYKEGRDRRVLNCDYAQFAETLINGYQYRWTRWSCLSVPFRQKHEQVNWKEKEKKTLSEKEQHRRDWRKKKGVHRDKQKKGWSQSRRGPGKWYKNYSQKLHRSWQKTNLHNQNWEELMDRKKIKYLCDPWLWD